MFSKKKSEISAQPAAIVVYFYLSYYREWTSPQKTDMIMQ
ncbi:hypothetical protein LEP1GSC188_0185 [Leptospira weilii serovar Topaz str. LT2116]|uniref:Uncharacterized protein n=1 Tax=Leptospira weilii serovar Topaz str. LT2116 TaxID=1088540 RepID=M3EN77_9LEPT|nr:hypothetical protein LEP1GSC188_0185 [Leptospira weilii serovar Topaz str. LT2116]